jgi:hypothetical protein
MYCCIPEVMTVIGRISDVVRSGHRCSFVAWRSEGKVMAMQCNFYRLQLLVFTNNELLHTRKRRLIRLHRCHRTRQMNSGCLAPETASSKVRKCGWIHCVMQRKISSRVQRIHCQLTGPAIAGHRKCLTVYHQPLCFRGRRVNTEFLELCPWPV